MKDRLTIADKWMMRWTAVIAISGIVAAFIFGFQLKAMRDQLAEMRTGSVDRPWIGFAGVTVSPAVTEGKITDISLNVINAGRRPARTLESRVSADTYEQFPENPRYSLSAGESPNPSRSVIVPGLGLANPFKGKAYPPPIIKLIKNGAITFYVYGIVEYEDVGTREKHTTKICQFFVPAKNAYAWCPEYNDAN